MNLNLFKSSIPTSPRYGNSDSMQMKNVGTTSDKESDKPMEEVPVHGQT